MKKVEAGLEIIEFLLEKYPDNNDLLIYKVFWLQYLDYKEESFELIQNLIESEPNNATYHDTFGEILMYFSDYEQAIEEFQKSINGDSWYIYQTYIKLGIRYKEIENFDLATEFFQRGIQAAEKSIGDQETKIKWITLANLFITEIEQLEAEF
jgi:tetratricopeptide (TPR) repeat protein